MLTHMLRAAVGNSGPLPPSGSIVWTAAGLYLQPRLQGFGFGSNAGAWFGGGNSAINGAAVAGGSGASYNGTVWASANPYPLAYARGASAGTFTAGITMTGTATGTAGGNSYTFNGTSFTAITAATAKNDASGSGTQTAALVFGGQASTTGQRWNGSAWSAMGALSVVRQYAGGGIGTETDTLVVGGQSPTVLSSTEKYNGTTWAASTAFPTAIYATQPNGFSTTAGGVAIGYQGGNNNNNNTYTFNGTAWTLASYAIQNGSFGSGFGSNTTGMIAGGTGSAGTNPVPLATQKMTYSSLLTGGVYSGVQTPLTPRRGAQGIGSPAAMIFACGANGTSSTGTYLTTTEKFDGTTWTVGPSMASAVAYGASCGTYSAGGSFGGFATGSGSVSGLFQSFNGTAFSTGGAFATPLQYTSGFGTTTAAAVVAGQNNAGTNLANTFKYNGSTWSASTALPVVRYLLMGSGASSSDGIVGGGYDNSSATTARTYTFNGTAWTEVGTLVENRVGGVFLGNTTINSVCSHGLNASNNPSNANRFNGSTWTTLGLGMAYRTRQVTGTTTSSSSGLVTNGWNLNIYWWASELFTG
jgi:hypothetical protein